MRRVTSGSPSASRSGPSAAGLRARGRDLERLPGRAGRSRARAAWPPSAGRGRRRPRRWPRRARRRGAARRSGRRPCRARCRRRAAGGRAACACRCRAAGGPRAAPARSSIRSTPRGLPAGTSSPCSRRHRWTRTGSRPASTPRAKGALYSPLRWRRCSEAPSARARPQRGQAAVAARRADGLDRLGHVGEEHAERRVVAARQPEGARPAQQRTRGERAPRGHARRAPRLDDDHAGVGQLAVGAADRGGRRPLGGGQLAHRRQRRARGELALGDSRGERRGQVEVAGHRGDGATGR